MEKEENFSFRLREVVRWLEEQARNAVKPSNESRQENKERFFAEAEKLRRGKGK